MNTYLHGEMVIILILFLGADVIDTTFWYKYLFWYAWLGYPLGISDDWIKQCFCDSKDIHVFICDCGA